MHSVAVMAWFDIYAFSSQFLLKEDVLSWSLSIPFYFLKLYSFIMHGREQSTAYKNSKKVLTVFELIEICDFFNQTSHQDKFEFRCKSNSLDILTGHPPLPACVSPTKFHWF